MKEEFYIPIKSAYDPDELGHFGIFGGRYVPETLMPTLEELKKDYEKVRFDEEFWSEVDYYYKNYVGRPNPIYFAENISKELGAKVYLKREDLNHTGAHKGNTSCSSDTCEKIGKKENNSRNREQDNHGWFGKLRQFAVNSFWDWEGWRKIFNWGA